LANENGSPSLHFFKISIIYYYNNENDYYLELSITTSCFDVHGVDEETAKNLRSAQWLDWTAEEDF